MKIKAGYVVVLLLIALIGYVFSYFIEFYDETASDKWGKKAQRNPYLAAEQFLELRGNDVESSNRLKRLDVLPEGGSIFIADPRQLKKKERIEALLAWMERGGHLVVAGRVNRDEGENVLLDHFGVTVKKADCECDKEDADDEEIKKLSELLREENKRLKNEKPGDMADAEKEVIPDAELTKLVFEGVGHTLKIHFNNDSFIDHPYLYEKKPHDGPEPFYMAYNDAGPQFMQFYVGDGLFTVLSDGAIWRSGVIDKVDHAYLLSILLDSKNKVVLLRGMHMPSVITLLSNYAPELLFASVFWLLVWLLYRMKRFGPVREQDVSSRRSLDEHIVACAGHIWRSKKRDKLVDNIQQAVFNRIKRKNLGFSSLDAPQQISWVSQHTGLSEKEIHNALFTNEVASEEQLNKLTRLIQTIGQRL